MEIKIDPKQIELAAESLARVLIQQAMNQRSIQAERKIKNKNGKSN